MFAGYIDIHRQLDLILELFLPVAQILTGSLGNKLGDGDNQAGFFSNGNK